VVESQQPTPKAKPRIYRYGFGAALKFKSADEQIAKIEIEAIRRGGHWKDEQGNFQGEGLAFHYKELCKAIWPHIDWHRWTELCNQEIRRPGAKVTTLMGAGCVAGHTRILNPITGELPTIKELYEKQIAPVVMTLHGPALAGIPFVKGFEDLFEVVLGDGSKFTATAKHRILSTRGFLHVSELLIGETVFSYSCPSLQIHPVSSSGLCLSIRGQDGCDFPKKAEDFQVNYSADFRLCGEQLHSAREACESSSPSQADAPEHNLPCFDSDGQGRESKRIHPYQSCGHPSNSDAYPRGRRLETSSLRHSFGRTLEQAFS